MPARNEEGGPVIRKFLLALMVATIAIGITAPTPANAECGKISWFGGPYDSMSGPTTASGKPVSVPAISLYRTSTLRGWWFIIAPTGKAAVIQQTDIGPAPWTGKKFDFTYTSLHYFGYQTPHAPGGATNFPTGATICGARFLPYLRHRDHGGAVLRARQLLHGRGVKVNRYRSYYDARLRKTVWHFQKDHGLPPDGRIGPKTWAKLYGTRTVPRRF